MSLMVIDPYRFAGGISTDTGFVLAGTGASVANGSGTAWSNPGNITASDNSDAVVLDFSAPIPESAWLRGSNFGLAIPGGATIDGIEIQVEGAWSFAPAGSINRVNIGKDGSTLATEKTPSQVLTSSDVLYTFGGSTDLWGLSWTPAEINASTFLAQMTMYNAGSAYSAAIDAMWIKVYYTT